MELTHENLTKLNVGLKKICDSCDEQTIRLHELIDESDEIAAEVLILWGLLSELTQSAGPGAASSHPAPPLPLLAQG